MNGALGGSTPYGYPLNARSKALQAAMDDVIRSLFRNGEKGVWFDPSDLSTMYQDSGGTTPVTALGQPVGLILDKSQGLALGPELVPSDYLTNTSVWTVTGGSIASVGGKIVATSSAAGNLTLKITGTYSNPRGYFATYRISQIESGRTVVRYIRGNGDGDSSSTAQRTFNPISGNTFELAVFVMTATSAGQTFTIDNISVREIKGNHAYQSTAASRPTLEARVNMFQKTEQFSDAAWSKTGNPSGTPTVGASVTDPNGGNAGFTVNFKNSSAEYIRQGPYIPTGVPVTLSAYVKRSASGSATAVRLTINNTLAWNTGGSTKAVLTNTWTRISLTATPSGSNTFIYAMIGGVDASGSLDTDCVGNVDIAFPQIEMAATASTYQKVNTATDYTDIGAPRYLNFDGTDDFLVMPSIDFTGTSVLTSFAAVRKHAATNGCVWASSTEDTNGAGMMMGYIHGARAGYWVSNGTNNGARALSSNYSLNPEVHSAVLTLGVAAASQVAARVNGSAASNASNPDAGSGNFQNLPIYIGRRNGSTLPLNGRIYGLVIRGASTPTATMDRVDRVFGKKAKVSW